MTPQNGRKPNPTEKPKDEGTKKLKIEPDRGNNPSKQRHRKSQTDDLKIELDQYNDAQKQMSTTKTKVEPGRKEDIPECVRNETYAEQAKFKVRRDEDDAMSDGSNRAKSMTPYILERRKESTKSGGVNDTLITGDDNLNSKREPKTPEKKKRHDEREPKTPENKKRKRHDDDLGYEGPSVNEDTPGYHPIIKKLKPTGNSEEDRIAAIRRRHLYIKYQDSSDSEVSPDKTFYYCEVEGCSMDWHSLKAVKKHEREYHKYFREPGVAKKTRKWKLIRKKRQEESGVVAGPADEGE